MAQDLDSSVASLLRNDMGPFEMDFKPSNSRNFALPPADCLTTGRRAIKHWGLGFKHPMKKRPRIRLQTRRAGPVGGDLIPDTPGQGRLR